MAVVRLGREIAVETPELGTKSSRYGLCILGYTCVTEADTVQASR